MFGQVFMKDNIENIFNAFGICDKIFKPVLTVNDLCISYRTINNWEANGLMLTERTNDRSWHKFSFIDFTWLNIVFELRQLGFPLTKIRKVKDFLNENIDDDSIFEVKRKEARLFLENKNLSRLVLLLAEIMYNKNHIALLCNKDGSIHIYNEQLVKEEKQNFDFGKFQFNNFVSVSLTDIIIKYLSECSLEVIIDSKIANTTTADILGRLREKEIDSIIFRINDNDSLPISRDLFDDYGMFEKSVIRLILTLKFEDIVY